MSQHLGSEAVPACRTCELLASRDAGTAPDWDCVTRTPFWDVVHAFGTSVEAWMVLVLRRHAVAISDLADEEASELGPLVVSLSRAVEAVTGCSKTYVALFAEHPSHAHVHVHVIPRAPNLDDAYQGRGFLLWPALGRTGAYPKLA